MGRFHRKTAPGVRDGRVQRKNNWKRSPDCYSVPQLVPAIDRRRPGPGHRHLLLKRDIERFVRLIPDWDKLAVGLHVIVLDCGTRDCYGWHYWGEIGICAWPTELREEVTASWFRENRGILQRIEARVEIDEDPPNDVIIHWSPWTARAFQLCDVFLHELGHHHDRMTTRTKGGRGPRGEPYAEDYARKYGALIWERYLKEFGLPE